MAEEFGGRARLEEILETTVASEEAERRRQAQGRPKKLPKARAMNRAKAEQMAADLGDYDGRIVAGRLT